MKPSARLSRRTVLRGAGAAVALPWLEAMAPLAASADGPSLGKADAVPRRMAFLYVPNGAHMADWTPKDVGSGFQIPATLKSLEAYKDHLLVLTGLAQHNAEALGDGPGDHARSLACFLTGAASAQDGRGGHSGWGISRSSCRREGGQTNAASLTRARHRARGSIGQLRFGV